MYSIRSLVSLVFCSLIFLPLQAQHTFSAPDTIKYLIKDTGFNTLHDFLNLKNHTGDSLPMRWKQHRINYPAAWGTTLDDPTKWHNPVDGLDSADFVLPDSASDAFNTKLIIGVDHNGIAGQGTIVFTVFDLNQPQDSVRLYFDVLVRPAIGLKEDKWPGFSVYPSPAKNEIHIAGKDVWKVEEIYLTDLAGQRIPVHFTKNLTTVNIYVANLLRGFYVLSIKDNQRYYHQKIELH